MISVVLSVQRYNTFSNLHTYNGRKSLVFVHLSIFLGIFYTFRRGLNHISIRQTPQSTVERVAPRQGRHQRQRQPRPGAISPRQQAYGCKNLSPKLRQRATIWATARCNTARFTSQNGPYGQTKHGGMAWESPGVNKKYRRPRSACRCLWPRRHIGTTGRPTSNKKQETAYFHAFITRNEGKFAIFAKVMLLRRQPTQPSPG